MAVKTFRQVFNTFKGLHEGYTHLTRPLEYAHKCQNFILDEQNNLVGRPGIRQIGDSQVPTSASHLLVSQTLEYPKYGLHTYRYQALDGSGEIEEIVGVGNQVFRLKKGTMTVTYSGSGTGTIDHYTTGAGGSEYFESKVDGSAQYQGVTVSAQPIQSSGVKLGAIKDGIEAFANWSVSLTMYAKANGAQTGIDFDRAITVDSGHTVTVATDKATMLGYYSTNGTPDLGHDFATVIATSATTVRLKPKSDAAIIDIADNAYLGTGLLDMWVLPYFYGKDCKTSPAVIDFYYWERVPWGSDNNIFIDSTNDATDWLLSPVYSSLSKDNAIRYFPGTPEFQNYKLVTYDNSVYIAAQGNVGQLFDWNPDAYTRIPLRKSGLLQYDGQTWHQAIMPVPTITAGDGGAGSLAAGTYKYIARLKFTDYQGNVHYGPDTLHKNGAPVEITIAASRQISVAPSNLVSITNGAPIACTPLRTNAADNAGTQSFSEGVSVGITILNATDTDNQYGLYVGDTAAFLNADTNQICKAKVTQIAYVGSTEAALVITPPEDGTIADGSLISNDYVYEIFRTDVNNNQFYYLTEIPLAISLTQNYIDNETDITGNALYDGPFTGAFRRDSAPQLSTLEEHQGLLIGAGDPDRPNSLYWCNADDPWNWSASTNELTLIPPGSGSITAIASSDDNTLAVFGSKGVSFIAGDFSSGALSEIKRYEGDCGCPSRHGAIKIKDQLWWLANTGLRYAVGALLQPAIENFIKTIRNKDYTLQYNTAISTANRQKPLVKKAVACNHVDAQYAIWTVPAFTNDSTTKTIVYPSDATVELYFDYQNNFFATYFYEDLSSDIQAGFFGAGGMCIAEGKRWMLGIYNNTSETAGVLFRELGEYVNNGTETYAVWNYLVPFGQSITYDLKLAFDALGEPSVDKQFLRLKLYCEQDSDYFHRWITEVTTARNYILTGGTDTEITVSSATTYETEPIKLYSEKARVLQFRLLATSLVNDLTGSATGTGRNAPFYTGIEYEVALDYKKEEVSKA